MLTTINERLTNLEKLVKKLICLIGGNDVGNDGGTFVETDPTVPAYVKAITEEQIEAWDGKDDGVWEFPV